MKIIETKYKNGNLKEKFEITLNENGNYIKDGKYEKWYENGIKECEGEYMDGKKFGYWKFWAENGDLKEENEYDEFNIEQSENIILPTDFRKLLSDYQSNDIEEIVEVVLRSFLCTSKKESIFVEEGYLTNTNLKVTNGIYFNNGYLSPYFINNNESSKVILSGTVYILLALEVKLFNLLPILEKIAVQKSQILIISENFSEEVIDTLAVNCSRGTLKCAAVLSPIIPECPGDYLIDISTITGGKFYHEQNGGKLENAKISDLGLADKVIIDKNCTYIIDCKADKNQIDQRISDLSERLINNNIISESIRKSLTERISLLKNGIAIIKVGAETVSKIKHKENFIKILLDIIYMLNQKRLLKDIFDKNSLEYNKILLIKNLNINI